MIGSGKYDFPGIREKGALALKAALAGSALGAKLLASPFRKTTNLIMEWVVEWATNNGLVIFNIGAAIVDGKIDPIKFDSVMDAGLSKVQNPGITDAEKKAIDDDIKKAFRKLIGYNRPK